MTDGETRQNLLDLAATLRLFCRHRHFEEQPTPRNLNIHAPIAGDPLKHLRESAPSRIQLDRKSTRLNSSHT